MGMACLLASLGIGCKAQAQNENILVKNGEKIAFLGDSITEQGAKMPLGYVKLVINGLAANGVKADMIPAGIGGNKSDDMLARVKGHVISKNPQWMTLSCGVNDVWHGVRGVSLEDYKKNITGIVDQASTANIKVLILTATLIGEDSTSQHNQTAAPYNEFLRELAKERKLPIADLNADERVARAPYDAATPKRGNVFTTDGVHMNDEGNRLMATGVLRAFGLNEAQLKLANESWKDLPDGAPLDLKAAVTQRQMEHLKQVAAAQNRSINDLVNEQVRKYLDTLLAQKVTAY